MAVRITWKTIADFSPLHAAAMVCNGVPIADSKLTEVIGSAAGRISDRLAVADVETDRFWQHLIATCTKGKDDPARVEASLTTAGCGALAANSIAPTIAGPLADLKIAFGEAYPSLQEQLPLRGRPLTEQWEAVGPGLLAAVGRLTHKDLLVKRCTVALVGPACGGAGDANPAEGVAWIEAVLSNPHVDIPEVLRLAWLIARLGLGRPEACKLVDSELLPKLAAMALLPIIAEAGRELGVTGDLSLQRLAAAWHLRRLAASGLIEPLEDWWQQLRDGETPFPVGMKALEKIVTA